MSTWGLTQDELERLDAFHRQQLRSLLDIRYPDTIHNDDLYKRTKSVPLSEELRLARWRMLGHVLRMSDNVPAKQAMLYYFHIASIEKGLAGRPRTTLPVIIDKDLQDIAKAAKKPGRKKNTIKALPSRLVSLGDLRTLEGLARERKKWKSTIEDAHALLQRSQCEKAQ
jgi:hypothetical protein